MATITVNPESDEQLDTQVCAAIRSLIRRGTFAPGDPIPSVRRMALDARISKETVNRAYKTLKEEGWLTTQLGKQYIVAPSRPTVSVASDRIGDAVRALRELGEPIEDIQRALQAQMEKLA